jgi:hypothetical protein
MRRFFSLFILVIATGLSVAQAQQVIKGKINDETGAPLTGATVYLTAEQKGAMTDTSGTFFITSHKRQT